MSQVFQDGRVIPITPIKIENGDGIFQRGDLLKIRGTSKGKGFQGVVKRHGFHGGPKSHGQKDRLRAPGSIGVGGVQRVIKGLRMAGRMGGDKLTMRKIKVVDFKNEENIIFVKGALPGNVGSRIDIYKNEEAKHKEEEKPKKDAK